MPFLVDGAGSMETTGMCLGWTPDFRVECIASGEEKVVCQRGRVVC